MLKKWNIGFIKKWIRATDVIDQSSFQKKAPSSLKLFQGIDDLWMWNFRKIIETGDTRYLYVLENDYKSKKYPDADKWNDLFWKYLDAKGVDYKFRLRLQLKAKLAILENEELFEGKKNNVKIGMTKLKLESLSKDIVKSSDLENDAVLSKFIGFQINPKVTTVSQYIGYEKLLIKHNEAIKNNGRNNKR